MSSAGTSASGDRSGEFTIVEEGAGPEADRQESRSATTPSERPLVLIAEDEEPIAEALALAALDALPRRFLGGARGRERAGSRHFSAGVPI